MPCKGARARINKICNIVGLVLLNYSMRLHNPIILLLHER